MPWSTNTVSELRTAFAHAVRTAGRPVVAAARDFGISRKTAYKWLALFDAQQPLGDRSRRPHHSPTRTSDELEAAVLAVRDQFGWGPRKIVAYLRNNDQPTPPVRTAAAVLRRHGRVARDGRPAVRAVRTEPVVAGRFQGLRRGRAQKSLPADGPRRPLPVPPGPGLW